MDNKPLGVRPAIPVRDPRDGDILIGIHVWETVNADNLNYILGSDVVRENEAVKFYVLRNEEMMFGEISPEP